MRIATAVLLLVALTASAGLAAPPAKIIAEGDWSKPVAVTAGPALRGRLVLGERSARDNRREVIVYLELQDAREAVGDTMRVYCEFSKTDYRPEYKGGLQCTLKDKDGQAVRSGPTAFSGAVPRSEWVAIPTDASVRLRASPFGIHRANGIAIAPDLGNVWEIPDDDHKEYFLSGTFTSSPKVDSTAGVQPIWHGTLELPALKIVNRPARR